VVLDQANFAGGVLWCSVQWANRRSGNCSMATVSDAYDGEQLVSLAGVE
jgi:hypothetical protein